MDSCCFIDIVKQSVGVLPIDRDSDTWHCKKLLEAARAGDISVYTSLLSVGECVAISPGAVNISDEIKGKFRQLLTSGQYVRLVHPTLKTPQAIQDFRWKHNLVLGSSDAIHLASAIETGCVEFITTDDRLSKAKFHAIISHLPAFGMHMIRASSTGQLPERYRQGDILNA